MSEFLPRKLYLAGPMRGYKMHNFPAFFQASLYLRDAGFEIINPAERDMSLGFDPAKQYDEPPNDEIFNLDEALRYDLDQIINRCSGIVLMDGWSNSQGARIEWATAFFCGKTIYRLKGSAGNYHLLKNNHDASGIPSISVESLN